MKFGKPGEGPRDLLWGHLGLRERPPAATLHREGDWNQGVGVLQKQQTPASFLWLVWPFVKDLMFKKLKFIALNLQCYGWENNEFTLCSWSCIFYYLSLDLS